MFTSQNDRNHDKHPQLVVPILKDPLPKPSCIKGCGRKPRADRTGNRVRFTGIDDTLAYTVSTSGDYSFNAIDNPVPGRENWPPDYWFNGLLNQN